MKNDNKRLITILVLISFIVIVIIVLLNMKSKNNKEVIYQEKSYNDKKTTIYEQAEKNLKEYILDKYGFTPNIISYEVEKADPSLFQVSYTGNVIFSLEYNNKKFSACIGATGNKREDNYQYGEIVKDLMENINSDVQETPYTFEIMYGKECRINSFYNKNNLKEILRENQLSINLYYINISNINRVNFIKTKEIINNPRTTMYMLNYKSFESYKSRMTNDLLDIKYDAINLKNAIVFSNGNKKEYDFNLYEKDSISVYCEDKNNYDNILLEKTNITDVSQWNGNGFTNGVKASDSYSLSGFGINDMVYVYIPLSKINIEKNKEGIITTDIGIKSNLKFQNTFGSRSNNNEYIVFRYKIKNSTNPNFEFVAINSQR